MEPTLCETCKSDHHGTQSSDSSKTVIAIIRSQSTAGPLNELAAERKNVHVLLTDLSSPSKLQSTAEEIAGITGGGLDVLVFSAFLPGTENFMLPVSGLYVSQLIINDRQADKRLVPAKKKHWSARSLTR